MSLILMFLVGMALGALLVIVLSPRLGDSQEESSPPAGHEGRWLWSTGGAAPWSGNETRFAELVDELSEGEKTRGRLTPPRPLHLIEGGEQNEGSQE